MRGLLGCCVVLLVFVSAAAADVNDLIKKLGSKDNEVRRSAAKELGELGKDAKPAVKRLIVALRDPDRYVRRYSAEALGKIGPEAKEAIPGLSKLLGDGNQAVREAAIRAIGKMGDAGLPALTKALSGTTSDVQEAAIAALTQAGSRAVPALTRAIRDVKMDSSLRRKAIVAVLGLGPEAHKAVPALVVTVKARKAIGRDGRLLRLDAIKALGRLATTEDSAAVSALDNIVKDKKLRDNGLKKAARQALQQIQDRK